MKNIGILGGGASGVLAALFLDKKQFTYEVLEAKANLGGHASSIFDRGYVFDYGPHIMFSKDKEILDFMIRSLGENVHRCTRHNKVYFKDRLVKYPFENDLNSLPLQDNYECLMGYIYNPYREEYANPANLREWLLKVFGKGICERYLFPYNEKVWNLPVDQLSMFWADRIPNPPKEDIIKSALGFETEGYLHQLYYHYPRNGGYQAITEAWAQRINKPTTEFPIKQVNRLSDGKYEIVSGNRKKTFDQLISTLSIHDFIEIATFEIPSHVRKAAKNLIVNPMYVINFGIKGVDKNQYTAIYFPDPEFYVNRLSFPATFSPENAPQGHYSVQAEITCRPDSKTWNMSEKDILAHVKQGLKVRGLLPTSDTEIVYEEVVRSKYSYVVYDVHFQKNADIIRSWFPSVGIHLLGRFSYFEYINIDGAVHRAREIVGGINGAKVELT